MYIFYKVLLKLNTLRYFQLFYNHLQTTFDNALFLTNCKTFQQVSVTQRDDLLHPTFIFWTFTIDKGEVFPYLESKLQYSVSVL